jgi:hypothetical protein
VESTLLSITILPGIATSARLQRTEPRKKVVALDPYFPEELDTPEFRALWDEWLAHRKAKKVSLTPQTLHRQMNMLRGLGLERAMACLNNSLTNGYMGLFEPRMPGVQKPKQEEDENTRLADLLKQQAEKRKAAQQEVERVRRERIGTPVTARGTADHGKATESR